MRKTRVTARSATIFDLEFTAWDESMECDWSRPGEYTEIVQIGAIKLDATTAQILGEFETLIQPRVNPTLSDYFVNVTGITNEKLTLRAVDFATGYRSVLKFIGTDETFSRGRDDLVIFENLQLYGWTGAMPIGTRDRGSPIMVLI